MKSQISELQTTVRQRSLAEIRLRELERDLLADQKLHDLVVARLGGLDPFAEVAKPSARVVSVAEVPTEPSFPQRGRVLAGGAVGATVLAIILAVMLEALDSRIRSGTAHWSGRATPQPGQHTKGPARAGARPGHALRRLVERPRSTSAEAFRSLYLACRAQLPVSKAVILVTSPLPGDGTTSVALGFAFSAAHDGVKTLYLDLDLQPPPMAVKDLNKQVNQLEKEVGGTAFPSTPSSVSRVLIDWTSSDPPGSSIVAKPIRWARKTCGC